MRTMTEDGRPGVHHGRAFAAAACILLLATTSVPLPAGAPDATRSLSLSSSPMAGVLAEPGVVHVLSDDFEDGIIDDKWVQTELSDDEVVEANGRLEMVHPANGSPADFARILRSWRQVKGDFDARVEYSLLTYPALDTYGRIMELAPSTEVKLTNGVRMGLVVFTTDRDSHFATMERSNSGPDEAYAANFDDDVAWTGIGTRDRSGALRLKRAGSEITAYRMDGGFWSEVKHANVTSEDVYLRLATWGKIETFAAYEVRVAFDNLVVVESPRVMIAAEPTSGTAPVAVTFWSTIVGGVAPYAYSWTFGDGDTSSRPDPTHVYGSAGNHTVTLTVTDGAGRMVVESLTIRVAAAEAEETNGAVGPSTVTDGTSWIVIGITIAGIATVVAALRRRGRGPRIRL